MKTLARSLYLLCGVVLYFSLSLAAFGQGSCTSPANAIVAENCLTGNPSSEWDPGIGGTDPSIVGFADDISVNVGHTINFKVNTNANAFTMDIYRMGYYGRMGARKVASIMPLAPLPQTQPACTTDPTTKLVDCGNWAVTASWQVPTTATSGIYLVHIDRNQHPEGQFSSFLSFGMTRVVQNCCSRPQTRLGKPTTVRRPIFGFHPRPHDLRLQLLRSDRGF